MSDQPAGDKADEESANAAGNGANWYLLRGKTLRESAGMRKQALAKQADVDRSTIDKLEKRTPVTRPTAFRVLNALQKHHAVKLDPKKEITDNLRKRS